MKVYFILDSESNAVKIGKANNIHERLSDLQTGNPNTLRLIHQIDCESEELSFLLEQTLHKKFNEFRKSEKMKKETVEEFLARGGKLKTVHTEPRFVKGDYSDKEFEKKLHDFYNSKEWKEMRKKVHSELTHMCSVCCATTNLHVDHIKPLRYFWEQRLDEDNLQILCSECNLEKGSMLNWTKEWHIKTKNQFLYEKTIRKMNQRVPVVHTRESFLGLEDYEKNVLNACYMIYRNLCEKSKIEPVSMLDLRNHIEYCLPKNLENSWFHDKEIKSYVRKNFKLIGTEQIPDPQKNLRG